MLHYYDYGDVTLSKHLEAVMEEHGEYCLRVDFLPIIVNGIASNKDLL